MRLVVSLATRGRPQQLLSTIAADLKCLSRDNTVLMVQVDDDDAPTIVALQQAAFPQEHVLVDVRPREDTIAAKWNRAMSVPADVYLVAADDDPLVTPDTDEKILQAATVFGDGIGMVYGHLVNLSFTSIVAPTAKLVDKLGHIQPEFFPYWFCDHWTDDLSRMIGRMSFCDVTTDQSKVGRTQELREPAWWATWFDAAYRMRRKIAHDIIGSGDFDRIGWQSNEVLVQNFPLIEQRSRMINNGVRANARSLEWSIGNNLRDERYKRVKAAAVVMLPSLLNDYGMTPIEANVYRQMLDQPTSIAGLKRAFA